MTRNKKKLIKIINNLLPTCKAIHLQYIIEDIKEWQDLDRTYTRQEQVMDTRIDC